MPALPDTLRRLAARLERHPVRPELWLASPAACWRRALALDPDHLEATVGLAIWQMRQGALDEAGGLLARALTGAPALLREGDDPSLAVVAASVGERIGRAAEALERVLHALPCAQGTERTLLQHARANLLDRLASTHAAEPSSGRSTLLEQALSRHPDIAAGGEIETLRELAIRVCRPGESDWTDARPRLDRAERTALGRAYLTRRRCTPARSAAPRATHAGSTPRWEGCRTGRRVADRRGAASRG